MPISQTTGLVKGSYSPRQFGVIPVQVIGIRDDVVCKLCQPDPAEFDFERLWGSAGHQSPTCLSELVTRHIMLELPLPCRDSNSSSGVLRRTV